MSILNRSIRKLINEEKNNISDEALFGSMRYREYLQKIVNGILLKNKLKTNINVITSFGSGVSCTDSKFIEIDTGCRIAMSFPMRYLKSESIVGILGHELGHILYTDFSELNKYFENLENGNLYPNIDKDSLDDDLIENLNEINELLLVKNIATIKVLGEIGSSINNILEDVYVNTLVCKSYPGSFKKGIIMNNIRAFEKSLPIQEQIDKEFKEISIITNILISYAILGRVNNLGDYEGEYLEFLDECIPIIDNSVLDNNATVRFQATNEILIRAWKWIKPLIDETKDNEEALKKVMEELSEQVEKISVLPIGTTKKDGAAEELEVDDKINSEEIEEINKSLIELEKTDEITSEGTGTITHKIGYESTYKEPNSKNLEKILDEMAFEKVSVSEERKLSEELQKYSNDIRYGNAHKDVDININRKVVITDRMKDDYFRLSEKLIPISKRLQKHILPILKESKSTKVLRNQISGKRIDMKSVIQDNSRYFSSKQIPNTHDLAIGILIDESGSMSYEGRIEISLLTAILLEDFCGSLEIPTIIYGHTEVWNTVELFSYSEFDSIDNNDKFRLMDIRARSGNRDGCAIRYVCERLLTRDEDIKLMIIISDGQPSATGYSGTEAEADIRGIKREYENKGITMFAAAIGDDKDSIQRIYKNGFLDISNIDDLPKRLATLITKHIKL